MSFDEVKFEVDEFCNSLENCDASPKIVAVSKRQPVEKIISVLDDGHRIFGENRVVEALEKFIPLKEKYDDIELHLIGHLQTNKVKDAVRVFDVIQTIDSVKLADKLKAEMDKQGKNIPCFIQVNTGDEDQKGGVAIDGLNELYNHCVDDLGLNIKGLMCIPPQDDVPDLHFALLHKLAKEIGVDNLSMGMSVDYKSAIKFGATHIRVGTAIFGERTQ